MRILHYLFGLPPVYTGGLVKYALDLARQQALDGNEVTILIPGEWPGPGNGRQKIHIKNVTGQYESNTQRRDIRGIAAGKDVNAPEIYKIVNPLPVSYGKGIQEPGLYLGDGEVQVYRKFLEGIKPDIIHLHSLMGLHKSFLEAARELKLPVVFTTHDYYGLCPKASFMCEKAICEQATQEESVWEKCYACCDQAMTAKQLKWQQSDLYRSLKNNAFFHKLEYAENLIPVKRAARRLVRAIKGKARQGVKPGQGKQFDRRDAEGLPAQMREVQNQYESLRQYYREMFGMITYFHFNSAQTAEIYQKKLPDCVGEVLSISGRNISDRRKEKNFKGKLHIGYLGGAMEHKGYQELFRAADMLWDSGRQDFVLQVYGNYPQQMPYLEKRKPYGRNELPEVFDRMDVLVVPSLCPETFGLVVAEALSFGVPVIVSSNVGAKDLLAENDKNISVNINKAGVITQYGVELCMSIDCLYQYLVKIYDDREILHRMNRNICRGKFDFWEGHAGKLAGLYERAMRADKTV